jgi:hypothetical protein
MQSTLCDCQECKSWRQTAIAHWQKAKEDYPNHLVFLQPKGTNAAYALLDDARLINSVCGHMILSDTFGVPDVFVCDLAGVRKALRRLGRGCVLVTLAGTTSHKWVTA